MNYDEGHFNDTSPQILSDSASTVFQEAFWLRCWVKHFLKRSESLFMHQYFAQGSLAITVPLIQSGRFVRSLRVVRNSHTPMVDLAVSGHANDAAGSMLDYLNNFAETLTFSGVRNEEFSRAIASAAEDRRLVVERHPPILQSTVRLSVGWETFKNTLSRKLVQNTERAERQLKQLGRLEFTEISTNDNLDSILAECFELEALSWKGAEGTAISSRAHTLGFYTDLALEAAARNALVLYTLRLDGRLIAFDYCLKWNSWLHLLKIGFDAGLSKFSPGNVIRSLVFQREFQARRVQYYDLGMQSEWKMRWTSDVMLLSGLTVFFGNARAHIAYFFGVRARNRLKRVVALKKIVDHARQIQESRRRVARRILKGKFRKSETDDLGNL